MNSLARCSLSAVAGLACFVLPRIASAEVFVSGHVYQISESGEYSPLPGVEIQAYRESPILDKPAVSDADGSFNFGIRAGTPFRVLFFGETKVPELQVLAGKDSTDNRVHVALSTERQGKTHGVPVQRKLEFILSQLPQEDRYASAIKRMLRGIGPNPYRPTPRKRASENRDSGYGARVPPRPTAAR